ncbi:MAG: hypothetical protein LAC70_08480 [Methylovulum sp.]|jgi:hypothetical protein|nr:hypothetical protein [Methylovulum sp.]
MSNDEKTNENLDAAKATASNMISSFMALKENNPKVFFGSIGGIAVILILIIMSGGSNTKTVKGPDIQNLAVGQRYILKSANAYDKDATVRLVSVPGAIAAYDDTEAADRSGACQHIIQGTPVSVVELQDAYGKKNTYSKVQIEEGECKGSSGWVLSVDVQ